MRVKPKATKPATANLPNHCKPCKKLQNVSRIVEINITKLMEMKMAASRGPPHKRVENQFDNASIIASVMRDNPNTVFFTIEATTAAPFALPQPRNSDMYFVAAAGKANCDTTGIVIYRKVNTDIAPMSSLGSNLAAII